MVHLENRMVDQGRTNPLQTTMKQVPESPEMPVVDSSKTDKKSPKQSRKMKRRPSRMIKRQLSLIKLRDDDQAVVSIESGNRRSKRCEYISFLELIDREFTPTESAILGNKNRPRKSALKKRSRATSLKLGAGGIGSTEDSSIQKQVRFAANEATKKVWCLVKTFPKLPESRHSKVWWGEEDMEARSEEDMDTAAIMEVEHRQTLEAAYDSISPRHELDLSPRTLSLCSQVRGIEADIFPERTKAHVASHQKSVLAAQQIIRENGAARFSKFEIELIAKQSRKGSSQSEEIAHKMGYFDQQVVKMMYKINESRHL
eukprot:CAMPEP_0172448938 /NCGR_PEP_ID=MMETSP1065-20121228/7811_1 /TAXON_ID=265537 /ORGANISM="Amphiprora paludosa, Strain CCMP125" /LENGTH=314 /DNA_ID=CAMNT_0013200533 /DNA_START=167 /DNA_END=1111 /DNA_ORIENTATION=+